jgi:hypothetical protein
MLLEDHPKTTKEAIFSLLLEYYPKRPAAIWKELGRFGISVTIQGVVKALGELEEKGIVARSEHGYLLSPYYIQQLQKTSEKVSKSYSVSSRKLKGIAKSVEIYTAKNMLEQDAIWEKVCVEWARQRPNDKVRAWIGRHPWVPFARLENEDRFEDAMRDFGIIGFNVVTGTSKLDRVGSEFYNKAGLRTKIDSRADIGNVYMEAFSSFYIRCELPKEIANAFERIFKKTKSSRDLNIKEVIDITKMEVPVTVLVIHDSMSAQKIRRDILNRF